MKKNATIVIALFLLLFAACDSSHRPITDNGDTDGDELIPDPDKVLPDIDTGKTDDGGPDGDIVTPEGEGILPESEAQPDDDEESADEVIPDEMVDEEWDGGDDATPDDMLDEDTNVPDIVEPDDGDMPFDDETPDTFDSVMPTDTFDALTNDEDALIPDADEPVPCEDEGQACTEEVVLNGQCLHLPRHELCDAAEMCSPANGCVNAEGWLCRSCAGGLPCAYPTDICASLLGTSVCLTACVSNDECLPSFSCLDIYDEEDNFLGRGCKPDSQICCVDFDGDMAGIGAMCQMHDCDENDPNVRPGVTEVCNGIDDDCSGVADDNLQSSAPLCAKQQGICFGSKRSCGGASGWLPCSTADYQTFDSRYEAVEATCDLADNDCNGQIDEPFAAVLYKSCTSGLGICERSGFTVCNEPGTGVVCNAEPGPKDEPEKCNNLDDDCDGFVDNGFPNKNTVCTVGAGICQRTGIYVCAAGGTSTECNVTPGSPAPGGEICNGLDDNCDNSVDNGLTGALCPNQKGVCAGTRQSCGGFSGWLPCGPTDYANQTNGTYEQNETICDGKDNDCDDAVDENVASYAPLCPLQNGVCKGSRQACGGLSGWLACTATNYGPEYEATETQCDYLDNDCDTQVDEGYKNQVTGKYDQNTACGNCETNCTVIYNKPNGSGTCNATGSPICQLTCNGGYFNLNGIPDDGCEFALESSVIYVSTSDATALDDAACGLGPNGTGVGNHPCKTITYGITRATATGRTKIYVADGLYEETVTLANGKSLYGGYKADTWERHLASSLTVWRGNEAGTHKRTVVASGITSATVVEGFVLYGQAATATGGNSYVFHITGSNANLTIRYNTIYGASGGPGSDGTAGTAGVAGGSGTSGPNSYETSSDNCTDSRQNTNRGTNGSCSNANGGNGGGNVCPPSNNTRNSGVTGFNGEGAGGGAGGLEGYDGRFFSSGSSTVCNDYELSGPMEGLNGANGASGAEGVAGGGALNATGGISGTNWVGANGLGGGNGAAGGGGGGGGAGGGGDDTGATSYHDTLGGHGGGGGAGGCGATGATYGTAGGGSFVFFLISTTAPTVQNNTIFIGTGGAGGKGGNGGVGGAGGNGGDGGAGRFCGGAGGKGGKGGRGGHGGGGGGGAGGVAIGVAMRTVTGAPDYTTNNSFSGGAGGAGGGGGASLGNPGSTGVTGYKANTYDFGGTYCGNGVVETGETCDLGTGNGKCSTCDTNCTTKAVNTCGDGFACVNEACDNGGNTSGCVACARLVPATTTDSDNAKFISWTGVPATIKRGTTFTFSIVMQNTGSLTWDSTAPSPHNLGSQSPQDTNVWGTGRLGLGASTVAPSGSFTFTYTATAPATPGTYNFQWRMVHDAVQWFGEYTPNQAITVTY